MVSGAKFKVKVKSNSGVAGSQGDWRWAGRAWSLRRRAELGIYVETLHPVEIPHVSRVFCFHSMQGFHGLRTFHAGRRLRRPHAQPASHPHHLAPTLGL